MTITMLDVNGYVLKTDKASSYDGAIVGFSVDLDDLSKNVNYNVITDIANVY